MFIGGGSNMKRKETQEEIDKRVAKREEKLRQKLAEIAQRERHFQEAHDYRERMGICHLAQGMYGWD